MLTREHQIWELTPKTNRFLSLRTIRESQRLRQHDNYLMHSDEVWRRQLKAFCTNGFSIWFSIRSLLLLLDAFHATANTEPEYCEDDSIISLSILIFRYEVFIIKREIQSIVWGNASYRSLDRMKSYRESQKHAPEKLLLIWLVRLELSPEYRVIIPCQSITRLRCNLRNVYNLWKRFRLLCVVLSLQKRFSSLLCFPSTFPTNQLRTDSECKCRFLAF